MCNVPKKKTVILLSTIHSDASVNDDAKRKPEVIKFCNRYKAGVETLDQISSLVKDDFRDGIWHVLQHALRYDDI